MQYTWTKKTSFHKLYYTGQQQMNCLNFMVKCYFNHLSFSFFVKGSWTETRNEHLTNMEDKYLWSSWKNNIRNMFYLFHLIVLIGKWKICWCTAQHQDKFHVFLVSFANKYILKKEIFFNQIIDLMNIFHYRFKSNSKRLSTHCSSPWNTLDQQPFTNVLDNQESSL